MSGRRLTTAATLLVLVVILVAMAVYGFKAATAPLPGGDAASQDCSQTEKQVDRFMKRSEVQVSVFNAGDESGLAGRTLSKLEGAGFRPGNAGNAPDGVKIRRAVVWTTEKDDTGALLVARALGKKTRVVVTKEDLGPGVDVLVGNRFQGLNKKAPKRLRLPAPEQTCIDVG